MPQFFGQKFQFFKGAFAIEDVYYKIKDLETNAFL